MDVKVIYQCDRLAYFPVWVLPNWIPHGTLEDWHLRLRGEPASRSMEGDHDEPLAVAEPLAACMSAVYTINT